MVTGVWVLAVKLPTVRRGLSSQRAKLAGDFAVFFILVGAVLLASIYLTAEDQVLMLKLFAILYFSLLPAVLYVQFSSRRTRTVWKDLFQLHMGVRIRPENPGCRFLAAEIGLRALTRRT